jgi:hypothetical protein
MAARTTGALIGIKAGRAGHGQNTRDTRTR